MLNQITLADILRSKSRYPVRGTQQRPTVVTEPETEERTDNRTKPAYIPTPEEIRQACLEIQSEWSESERLRRMGLREGADRPRHVVRNLLIGCS